MNARQNQKTTIHGRRSTMKVRNQRRTNSAAGLTADEHLWLQKEIEKRAHALWRAGGYRQMTGLNDWLQAEREMLEQLCIRHGEQRLTRLRVGQAKSQSVGAGPEFHNSTRERAERRRHASNFKIIHPANKTI